jgi:hypothetical protein
MALDASAKQVASLEGLGLAVLIISITCGLLSFIVVSLRTWTRVQEQTYGWDDGLMSIGMVTSTVCMCLALVLY